MDYHFKADEEFARELDRTDPLRKMRDRFYLNEDEIYMDGNSLGPMSVDAEESLAQVVDEWKNLKINGWLAGNPPWFYYSNEVSKMMAPLVGADPDEITIHSSTTINIHSLIATFYQPDKARNKILVDDLTFPTDRYAIDSQLALRGNNPADYLIEVRSKDGRFIDEENIIKEITDDVSIVFLPSVLYRSGQLLDMKYLTTEAHKRGVIIGFDCCHSVGVIPHELSKWGVDFAMWCNYKYLNIGPGGPASLYIHRKHFNRQPGLSGWFGYVQKKQFDMLNQFESANNAGGWQTGTPHLLSMAPLKGALKLFNEVGIDRIREKSLKLTNYLMFLIEHQLSPYRFFIGNPCEDHRRGGHVALEHDEAIRINAALKAKGVIPDFRYPNLIRLAPVPLYSTYHEIWKVVQVLNSIMAKKEYERYKPNRGLVA